MTKMTEPARISAFNFMVQYREYVHALLDTEPFHTGEWQAMNTSASPAHKTYELQDVVMFIRNMPQTDVALTQYTQADQPWAGHHFAERVSGEPFNPPPSHMEWPYAVRGNGDHIAEGKFDHTYPERFWPRFAGPNYADMAESNSLDWEPMRGIRFEYGDLHDVMSLLRERPFTRQAYLPVWFPEDTGGSVRTGARHPCTLGYHFMIRDGELSCRYYLRSCDILRHFRNDVYFAGRLMQYMVNELGIYELRIGSLFVHISSLHAFVGDRVILERMITR